MGKYLRTILLLALVVILPMLIYAIIQVRSLDEDERMAQLIYEKQMETVLYSLNTYADDRMSRWVRQLSEGSLLKRNAQELINENESIQLIAIRNYHSDSLFVYTNDYVDKDQDFEIPVNAWYQTQIRVLEQLNDYLHAGYQKIQAADGWYTIQGLQPTQSAITVMFYDQDSITHNALFILETHYWVEQILGTKMQELSGNNFRLGISQGHTDDADIFYSTEPFEGNRHFVHKDFWIIPDAQLLIQNRAVTFTEIVKRRSEINLYILFTAIAVMVIGIWLILRNISNTMKLAQLKSDFVSNVSHEIRTPLSLIKMYAETLMLNRVPEDDKKAHYYQVIHHESGRLTYLVNNILDFSKIESNKKTYNKSVHDLNELVETIYENYQYAFSEKQVDCKLTLGDQPLTIAVDPQAFEEALSNLIENAIKYSFEEIKIEIKTYLFKDKVYCMLIDQGIGIPKNAQKHVFEKFYRVEDALTQKTKGAGLGLSLVQHIMEAHEGEISMHSIEGKGSTFTMIFPHNIELI